jgi:hypothetical protein
VKQVQASSTSKLPEGEVLCWQTPFGEVYLWERPFQGFVVRTVLKSTGATRQWELASPQLLLTLLELRRAQYYDESWRAIAKACRMRPDVFPLRAAVWDRQGLKLLEPVVEWASRLPAGGAPNV